MAKINRPLKTRMDSEARTVGGKIKIGDDKAGKTNKEDSNPADNNKVGNNKVGNSKADNNKGGNSRADSNKVDNSPQALAAPTSKSQTRKALGSMLAAARHEGATANSVRNCAKACARPKTYAATWARIVIWQAASIGRFKACGRPTTPSTATTCEPRCS